MSRLFPPPSIGDRVSLADPQPGVPGTVVELTKRGHHALVEWDNGASDWYDSDYLSVLR